MNMLHLLKCSVSFQLKVTHGCLHTILHKELQIGGYPEKLRWPFITRFSSAVGAANRSRQDPCSTAGGF